MDNKQIYYKIKAIENLRSKFQGPAMTSALTIYAILCLSAIEVGDRYSPFQAAYLTTASATRRRLGIEEGSSGWANYTRQAQRWLRRLSSRCEGPNDAMLRTTFTGWR